MGGCFVVLSCTLRGPERRRGRREEAGRCQETRWCRTDEGKFARQQSELGLSAEQEEGEGDSKKDARVW